MPNTGKESKPRWASPFFTLTARKQRANGSSCLRTLFFLNVLLFVAFNCISYCEPFLKEEDQISTAVAHSTSTTFWELRDI